MSLFEDFVEELIKKEGGYVNRPDDSGGETNFGITKAVARRFGYNGEMRKLPLSLAKQIYKEIYYDGLNIQSIEKISPAIAIELLDTGANQGVARAGEFFQRLLNILNQNGKAYPEIKIDGQIGAASIAAFRSYIKSRSKDEWESVFLKGLNCLQGAFYIELAERRQKDEAFIFGWLKNRVS